MLRNPHGAIVDKIREKKEKKKKKSCFISQTVALLFCNCDLSPGGSYPAQWQHFRNYRFLLIALLWAMDAAVSAAKWNINDMQNISVAVFLRLSLYVLSGRNACLAHTNAQE